MASTHKSFARPRIACEISAERVITARLAQREPRLESCSVRRLPAGTLSAGLTPPNILHGEALRQTITDALTSVGGGGRGRDVIAILPDATVRVLLVEFDTLPDKPDEVAAIIRFRVKKSLPFDVDDAALSFHTQSANGAVKVIAALAPRQVIHEYEAAFHAAGYLPGVAVPSILATLGLVDADRPTMVVKVDLGTTTVAIVDRRELLLLRTLDHPGRAAASTKELLDHVYPSMVFSEDTYHAKIEQLLVTGMANVEGLASELQQETGVRTSEIGLASTFDLNAGDSGTRSALAGVAGALLG